MKCVYMQYYRVVKKCTIHAPRTTSIHDRTDLKFESLLYIIETKCVSEFDMLIVHAVLLYLIVVLVNLSAYYNRLKQSV